MNQNARLNQLNPQAKAFALAGMKLRTPMAIADQQDQIIWTNPAFEEMTGYTIDELLSKKLKEFLECNEPERTEMEKLLSARARRNSVDERRVNYRKNGEKYFVQIQIAPILDDDGNLTHYVSIHQEVEDTSESTLELEYNLKQQELLAEIALDLNNYVEFEKSIHAVLDALLKHTQVSRIYIFENTLDGLACKNTFEVCNVGVEPQIEQLQYTPYDVISSWPKALKQDGMIFTEDIRTLPQEAQDILEPQNIKSILVLPLIVNGDFFGFIGFDECAIYKKWKRSDIKLLRAISGIISNAYEREITRKNLVAKNEDLNKINNELDRFVYSVSHDLRAPLLSIKGIINLILRTVPQDEKTNQLLRLAEQSASRLDDTIHEILDYSRNARLGLSFEEFDLVEMINQIQHDLKYFSSKKIEFSLQAMQQRNIVYSDKNRVNTILKNIIGNAYKYLKKEEPNSFIKVHVHVDSDCFEVVIIDNGEGIAAEHMPRIFEMFYRASKSGATGSGLGLYICLEIVNKMGGKIILDSKEEVGTTVRIQLPMAAQA